MADVKLVNLTIEVKTLTKISFSCLLPIVNRIK